MSAMMNNEATILVNVVNEVLHFSAQHVVLYNLIYKEKETKSKVILNF